MAIQNPILRHPHQPLSARHEGAQALGLLPDYQSGLERTLSDLGGSQGDNGIIGTRSDLCSSGVDESGQCRRLRDDLRVGEQDLMSEKDPVPRLDPSSQATSPRSAAASTSPSHPPNFQGGGGEPPANRESPEGSRVPRTNGDLTQPHPHRAIGVHTILNPTESQGGFSSNTSPIAPRTVGEGGNPTSITGQYMSSPTTQRPYSYPGQGTLRGHQVSPTPPVGSPASGPPSSNRASPNVLHPHPAVETARRYLTPRSPRASSSSQGPIRRPGSSHQSYFPTAQSGINRLYSLESAAPAPSHSPRSGPPPPPITPYYGISTSRPGAVTSSAPPARPLSQPAATPFTIPGPISPGTQGPPPHTRQQGYPTPYTTENTPSSLSYSSSLPSGGTRQQSGYGGISHHHQRFSITDGQPILAINPEGGERMLIPVNTDHASKAADEKRQRNAGASARFRQRKKDKDEAKEMALRRMESQARELERRNRELEAELDRTRADRNRLRDIVSHTPGISDLAYQGPPSPDPRRNSGGGSGSSGGQYLERSPLAPVMPSAAPTPVAGFTHPVDDPHAGERAARRRRTDPQLGYSMPTYVSTPAAMQPIPSPTYSTSLSQPGTPSTTQPAPPSTLPPLRLEPSSGPLPISGPPGTSSGHPAYSYRREPYESGWATRPSDPRDSTGR